MANIPGPVSVPPAELYSVAYKSGDCSWNDSTNTLSFSGGTACILTAAAAKTGYTTKTKDFSVTPYLGLFSSITWAEFPSSAVVGASSSALGDPVSTPAADNYAVSKVSGDCSWDNTAKTIAFTDATACVLRVTATKTGYPTTTEDFTVTPDPRGTILNVESDYSKINVWDITVTFNSTVAVDTTDGTPRISFASEGETKYLALSIWNGNLRACLQV